MADRGDQLGDEDGQMGSDAADQMRGALPAIDHLDMVQVRTRAERALFGSAAPAKLGRYVLLGKTTGGGMGVVHAAYDPELHRKVALKVVHPRTQHDRAHERLLVEARSLARLDHPNVVKLHDVLTHDDQVVLVMEWVEGDTLAAWERAGSRSWREIVQVYLQAAHGLSAAHGVGVVHRDFKPANAILGADGRARVLDFGLASPVIGPTGAAPTGEPALASGSTDRAWPDGLTASGAMVGTFAYAPPEQLLGGAATPASDQFSFAVALHRALEGVAPFAGDDIASRCAAIAAGAIQIARDRRAVPAWLRAILARALASDAARRFPSMQALISALTRPRGWRRWRAPAALAAVAIAAAVAGLGWRSTSEPEVVCDGGARDIGPLWTPSTRAQIGEAVSRLYGPGASRGADARGRVVDGLDRYQRRWTQLHRDACDAHRRGEQSAALLDRRMLCLRKRLVDLRETVALLSQIDARSVDRVVDVVARMPSIEDCGDLERLQAERPPPPAAIQADAVRVRDGLSQAAALDRAGRNAEATQVATLALERAEQTQFGPLIADASLALGRTLLGARDMDRATAVLSRAIDVALEHREFAIAVEAGARKLFTEGMRRADLAALDREVAFLLPLSASLPDDHFARPLLFNNIGTVYIAAGQRAEALRYFQQAHAAIAGLRDIDPELTCIDENLARVTADPATREALVRGSWLRRRASFGDGNLATLESLTLYARLIDAPAQALPVLAEACQSYAELHPTLVETRSYCELYRAFLAEQLGDRAQALQRYDRLAELGDDKAGQVVGDHAALARGSAAMLRGNLRDAVLAWQPVTDRTFESTYWWVRVRAAHAELGLAAAARMIGHDAEAGRHFERAIQGYRGAVAVSEESEYRLRLGLAEAGLAALRRPR